MHAKYGIGYLQIEITMAVLGDLGRSAIEWFADWVRGRRTEMAF